MSTIYDLAIIGGGPAGLTAAVYAARYKLSTLLVSKNMGGLALEPHKIENWPGDIAVSGAALMKRFADHAKKFGTQIKSEDAKGLKKEEKSGKSYFSINNSYHAKKIILALGSERRKLNIPREDEFAGRGLAYCATCDAPFFEGKEVAVVGGSNSAMRAAQLLIQYASKIYIIYRGDNFFRAEPALVEEVLANPKVKSIMKANVKEIEGNDFLSSVKLDNGQKLDVEGLFVEIGSTPSTVLAKELGVKLDSEGYIEVDAGMRTNVDGVYAAGDVTTGSNKFRQIVTAASEGAIAAASAFEDL
jgi:thioredoxin reductase (NADPH)